jgi:hypothetical protein
MGEREVKMEIFLIITALLFLISGSLLLLSPQTFIRISDVTNKVLINIDAKIHVWRRLPGILFLLVSIFLWYIGFKK